MFSFLLAIIYLCFISLGLPDSLLGAAWPVIHQSFNVPVSYAGIISIIICACTIISSLLSDKLTKKFTPAVVTLVSIILTTGALLGFSLSSEFYMLIIFAIPYGLGAGGVDACLNNYVALHYKSKHMSWLHAMWGLGATISPYIMGYVLTGGNDWNNGYLIVSIIQFVIAFIVLFTLPKWKKNVVVEVEENKKALGIRGVISIPGALSCLITFFCYCALEQTTMLWGSSYLVSVRDLTPELGAMFASMFCIGITLGRVVNGFLTFKLNDKILIRIGLLIIALGVGMMLIPQTVTSVIAFVLVGLGCAPIYPSIIHSTPTLFGKENSQAMIGVQMACAYLGTLITPPLFGLIANHISISLLPVFLIITLILMILMNEITNKSTNKKEAN